MLRTRAFIALSGRTVRIAAALVLIGGLAACSDGAYTPPTASAGPPAGSTSIQPAPPPVPLATAQPPQPPVGQVTCAPCTRIAFTSSRDGNDEIYTVNADGTGLTRLTHDASSDDYAAWSSDGRRIAFTSRTGDDSKLVVMNADGSNVVLHALPHFVWHPTWSPDGARITYSALSDGSLNIWIVDADGGWPVLLFSKRGWDGQPSWSPDGAKLALVSDWFAYDFGYDVFVVDPDGLGFAPLTDGNIFDPVEYLWPSWSPDGAKIALTVSIESGFDRYITYVGVMSRHGTGLKSLIAAAPSHFPDAPRARVSWSPDGTLIAFTSGSAEAFDVSWVKTDGSAWGTIITNGWNPAWQP